MGDGTHLTRDAIIDLLADPSWPTYRETVADFLLEHQGCMVSTVALDVETVARATHPYLWDEQADAVAALGLEHKGNISEKREWCLKQATAVVAADPRRTEAQVKAEVLAPFAPSEAVVWIGFWGCTDRDPDLCACGADDGVECALCGHEIAPGDVVQSTQRPTYDTLTLVDPDQSWDVHVFHVDCDRAEADRIEAGQ